MVIPEYIVAILIALLAGLIGFFWSHLHDQQAITRLHEDKARLQAQLDGERKAAMAKLRSFEQAREQFQQTFKALAGDALKSNSSEFLKLAEANLKHFQTHAQGDLSQRQKAVENLVRPIQQALEKTEKQVREMERERQQAFGSLDQHLKTMTESHHLLQGETRNLVQALRRPEVRGQWGELTLKRLAELAGMAEHIDFVQQESIQTEAGLLRPDMIVRMSDDREIVIDAKTSLDAYLSAIEARDDQQRDHHLERHARKVRERVRELASKNYWQQLPKSPEFVVLFIPGDQFLSSALNTDPQILEDALADKIILATPTSLVALLRTLAYGWRQKVLAENAEQIRKIGEDFYDRLIRFSDHLGKVGRNLNSSVEAYNKAVGSFDSRVLPGVRRFTELGIRSKKEIEELSQIERLPRSVETDQNTELHDT